MSESICFICHEVPINEIKCGSGYNIKNTTCSGIACKNCVIGWYTVASKNTCPGCRSENSFNIYTNKDANEIIRKYALDIGDTNIRTYSNAAIDKSNHFEAQGYTINYPRGKEFKSKYFEAQKYRDQSIKIIIEMLCTILQIEVTNPSKNDEFLGDATIINAITGIIRKALFEVLGNAVDTNYIFYTMAVLEMIDERFEEIKVIRKV